MEPLKLNVELKMDSEYDLATPRGAETPKPLKMNRKHLMIGAGMLCLASISSAATVITSLENADFEIPPTHFPTGFDAPGADIVGWSNYTAIADSGTEGAAAWWGTYDGVSAFMSPNEGAYNMSDYTIQPGDELTISFFAKTWEWQGDTGQWTVSLFYDDPANIIGSFTTSQIGGAWTEYTSPAFTATEASEGGKVGVIFLNTGNRMANLDNVSISVVPEPSSIGLSALAGFGILLRRRRIAR